MEEKQRNFESEEVLERANAQLDYKQNLFRAIERVNLAAVNTSYQSDVLPRSVRHYMFEDAVFALDDLSSPFQDEECLKRIDAEQQIRKRLNPKTVGQDRPFKESVRRQFRALMGLLARKNLLLSDVASEVIE